MNYDYQNINNSQTSPFPYGVNEIITFSPSDIAHVDISAQNIGDKKDPKVKIRIYIRLRTDCYLYAWFENDEQAIDAMKAIDKTTSSRIAVITTNGNDKNDCRDRRDYIVEVGSTLYYEAIKQLKIK